jgi:hypothetical protein
MYGGGSACRQDVIAEHKRSREIRDNKKKEKKEKEKWTRRV